MIGISRRLAIGMLVGSVAIARLFTMAASAAEICHFTGSIDYDGRVAVRTNVTESDGVTRVGATAKFEATIMFLFRIHYLLEEVSTWRDGELQSIAVNSRHRPGS